MMMSAMKKWYVTPPSVSTQNVRKLALKGKCLQLRELRARVARAGIQSKEKANNRGVSPVVRVFPRGLQNLDSRARVSPGTAWQFGS
jgi:hypothetical protein